MIEEIKLSKSAQKMLTMRMEQAVMNSMEEYLDCSDLIGETIEKIIADFLKKNPKFVTNKLKQSKEDLDLENRISEIFDKVEAEFVNKLLIEGLLPIKK